MTDQASGVMTFLDQKEPVTSLSKTGTSLEIVDFKDGPPELAPRLWVNSTAHWYGIWNALTRWTPLDRELKSDAAESFLTEAFFLGWDFGDCWSGIAAMLSAQILFDWKMNRRDGLIILSYRPKHIANDLLKGERMVYRIHETQESRDREQKQIERLKELLPAPLTVAQAGKFCGWDAVFTEDNGIRGIAEIKTRNYPKQFFNKNGLVLTKRKWDGLISYGKTYKVPALLLLCSSDGMFYLNTNTVRQDKIRVVITTNDRYDVPKGEEAVIIPGLLFSPLDEVAKEFE